MGTRVASILAEIGIDSSKFTTGARGVNSGIMGMIGSFTKLAGGIGIAVTALTTLYDFLKKSEQAAVESAKIDAKLEAVLKSTGGAAGFTLGQLDAYATKLSKLSGIDDEIVKNGEAVLLTFTKIGQNAFPQVMQAAMDMSAVLGSDLQGSIIQVGKAFNDFSGYTALKRAGVSFTQSQVDQINKFKEANDLVSYQNLLLAELSKEFGGAAKAMNDASDGAENLKVSWGNLQEAIGTEFVSATKTAKGDITDFLDSLSYLSRVQEHNNSIMEKAGYVYAGFGNWVKDGVTYNAYYAKGVIASGRATEAWTESLIAQARAYYLLHPELNKTVDAYGRLRDVQNGSIVLTDEEIAAIKDKIAAYSDLEKTYLNYATERTDWAQQWTSIEEGPDQAAQRGEASFNLLGDKLKELGLEGADIWQGLLEATGQISPEAIRQFAIVETEIQKIKQMAADGIPVDVIVSVAMNDLSGMGILPGEGGSIANAISDWVKKGTKGGPGTEAAWWSESQGKWYFGDDPNGTGAGATTTVTADTTQADSALNGVQTKLDGITDKTVTITVNTNYNGGAIGAAELAYHLDLNGNRIIGRAGGGPIWGNKPYLVGERGPELIVPRQNGNVIPNNQLGGNVVNFYGDAYFSVEGEVTAQDIMKQMRVEA